MSPRERIDTLKRALSVPEYFRITNHNLQKSGREYVMLCPFHSEKDPSCFLYEDHFHCYGCGEHGDVIDAHKKIRGVDFKTALEDLGRMAGITPYHKPRSPGRDLRIIITRKHKE
jgi:DNA primase